jgi:hypothetical protein
MTPRFIEIKHLVWAAALAFAVGVAPFPLCPHS